MPSQPISPYLPLAISLVALGVSCAGLGWNIYREVMLRGRLIVRFGVKTIAGPGTVQSDKVVVSATNFGPGPVTVSMIIYQKRKPDPRNRFPRLIMRRKEGGVILYDWTEPLSSKLPKKLELGDELMLVLKYGGQNGLKLTRETLRIGLIDSFGRRHWAPRKDIQDYFQQFEKDFPSENTA